MKVQAKLVTWNDDGDQKASVCVINTATGQVQVDPGVEIVGNQFIDLEDVRLEITTDANGIVLIQDLPFLRDTIKLLANER